MNQIQDRFVGDQLFGEYTIDKKLGEGGMGSVYLARNPLIDQSIAVKILHGNAADSDEIKQRFQREARVISMLTHPNIVRVFIFGRTDQDLLYMAMEFVEGRSLREHLQHEMVDELTAIKILKQCCSAVAEAHDLGIVHRDLKPDNILLTRFRGEPNFVKVLDFGIAKITDTKSQQQQLTQAGIVYGTPEYLSPEQAQAHPLDPRTDIYSMGVILYELMTGRVPFQSNSAVQVLTMHVFNEPEAAESVAPNRVKPTMASIIRKAMAKDKDKRFSTAMEFYQALEAREREVLHEQQMQSSANQIPGGELTGMFGAVRAPAQPGDDSDITEAPTLSAEAVRGPDQASTQNSKTVQNRKSSDTNRTVMIVVLIVLTLIVIFLGIVLAVVLLK